MGRAEVQAFFKKNNFLADDLDMNAELDRFVKSMSDGLDGSTPPESMLMIPTYLSVESKIETNTPVIVMDAGGTNFRICLTEFQANGEVEIIDFKKQQMPGVEAEIGKAEFYNFLADMLEPYLASSKNIGFCFSYPSEIQADKDGMIINFTKEVRIPEAHGTFIGQEIKAVLAERGHDTSDLNIVVLNDTVAALLGGAVQSYGRQYSGNAGIVLGTGINSAYVEQNENITKLEGEINPLGNMIINMESGDYNVSSQSDIDKKIDEFSVAPGTQLFEKMISGRYLGIQTHFALKAAVEEPNLFSDFFKESFAAIDEVQAQNMNEFIAEPYGTGVLSRSCANELDRENLYFIIDNIFERAAKLVAVLVTAIHKKAGVGKNPVRPLAFTIEGTTYYMSPTFRAKLDSYIKTFTNEEHGYYNKFLRVDNTNIIGSALAALTN